MKLSIRHETIYRYAASQAYSIQQLHVTPRLEAQQSVLTWNLQAPGAINAYTDAYGNRSHMLTLNEPHRVVAIVAEGLVQTTLLHEGRLQNSEPLSPLVFTVPTRLTTPTAEISDYAGRHLLDVREGRATTAAVLALAEAIHGKLAYVTGATSVDTTAHDAMLLGAGVCQDHAHLFLACCHAMGVPARYVSGYIDPGSTGHAASHAWVDAWVADADFEGWISIDITHARLMTDAYCRLAIGRDYHSAAPVRGSRRGVGEETMTVEALIVPV
ncbi:MAG: transglutaminase family protein [Massilia sp.]|jgi:transglutaminase-like putative cysteine protease|nr:transglutaminase family protein [Massilia sp.]